MQRNTYKNLEAYTVQELHALVIAAVDIKQLARQLGTGEQHVAVYIKRMVYKNSQLDFHQFQSLTVAAAKDYWGDKYWQTPQLIDKSIHDCSAQEICSAIWDSIKQGEAAINLYSYIQPMKNYLKNFNYQGKPLSYALIKSLPLEAREEFVKKFTSDLELLATKQANVVKPRTKSQPLVILPQKTIYQIHCLVRESTSCDQLAAQLLIKESTLRYNINFLSYKGKILTYETLKALSVPAAQDYFQQNYSAKLEKFIKSYQYYTLDELWQLAQIHQQPALTAQMFKISIRVLEDYLQNFFYNDDSINYNKLITYTSAQVQLYKPLSIRPLHETLVKFNNCIQRKRTWSQENHDNVVASSNKKAKIDVNCSWVEFPAVISADQPIELTEQVEPQTQVQQLDFCNDSRLTSYEEYLIDESMQNVFTSSGSVYNSPFLLFTTDDSNQQKIFNIENYSKNDL